jgi:hypothetical protein
MHGVSNQGFVGFGALVLWCFCGINLTFILRKGIKSTVLYLKQL